MLVVKLWNGEDDRDKKGGLENQYFHYNIIYWPTENSAGFLFIKGADCVFELIIY